MPMLSGNSGSGANRRLAVDLLQIQEWRQHFANIMYFVLPYFNKSPSKVSSTVDFKSGSSLLPFIV